MLIGNNICSCQPSMFWLPKCLPILTSKMFTSLRNKSRKSWISYHNTILSITIQKFILKSKGFHEIYFYTSPPYLPPPYPPLSKNALNPSIVPSPSINQPNPNPRVKTDDSSLNKESRAGAPTCVSRSQCGPLTCGSSGWGYKGVG